MTGNGASADADLLRLRHLLLSAEPVEIHDTIRATDDPATTGEARWACLRDPAVWRTLGMDPDQKVRRRAAEVCPLVEVLREWAVGDDVEVAATVFANPACPEDLTPSGDSTTGVLGVLARPLFRRLVYEAIHTSGCSVDVAILIAETHKYRGGHVDLGHPGLVTRPERWAALAAWVPLPTARAAWRVLLEAGLTRADILPLLQAMADSDRRRVRTRWAQIVPAPTLPPSADAADAVSDAARSGGWNAPSGYGLMLKIWRGNVALGETEWRGWIQGLADDPDPAVRAALAEHGPVREIEPWSPGLCLRLLTDLDEKVRLGAFKAHLYYPEHDDDVDPVSGIVVQHLAWLADPLDDPSPRVRAGTVVHSLGNPDYDTPRWEKALADPDPTVRATLTKHPQATYVIDRFAADPAWQVRAALARMPLTPWWSHVLAALAADPDERVRRVATAVMLDRLRCP